MQCLRSGSKCGVGAVVTAIFGPSLVSGGRPGAPRHRTELGEPIVGRSGDIRTPVLPVRARASHCQDPGDQDTHRRTEGGQLLPYKGRKGRSREESREDVFLEPREVWGRGSFVVRTKQNKIE